MFGQGGVHRGLLRVSGSSDLQLDNGSIVQKVRVPWSDEGCP